MGNGLVIYGAGPAAATAAITVQPTVTRVGSGTGTHTYCYVVDTVDPLGGISAPSPQGPQACVTGEPALSYYGVWNALNTNTSSVGPSPSFLWYVSDNNKPWQLVNVAAFKSQAGDYGQRPGTRGGWPNNMSSPDIHKNQDFFSYITGGNGTNVSINDALPSSFQGATIGHDDTLAVQNAINAAASAGGGTIQFGNGIYNIRRPIFDANAGDINEIYSTSLSADPYYAAFQYLDVPNSAVGHVHIQGNGSSTTINTAPDHGGVSELMAVGLRRRPNDLTGIIQISPVAKGDTSVIITNASDAASLHAGQDIFLYSGSFTGSPCPTTNNTPGECHFSELNTISSISGSTVSLLNAASKKFYNDGSSSFGMIGMPTTLHDFALTNLTINTFNPVLTSGQVYGVLIDTVTINGNVSHGPFGGGYKRDVTIQNSTWSFGTGDVSYAATDEYDQFTNVTFYNNNISGYAAPGAEGPSEGARLYATEGSSQFTYKNNTFTNASVYFDQTTDDVITNNTFNNGVMTVGIAYGPNKTSYCYAPYQDPSFLSYASQSAVNINTNTINISDGYLFPYLLRVGDFITSTITNNVLNYNATQNLQGISSYGGSITGNTVAFTGPTNNSVGICLIPDQSPSTPPNRFNVQNNTIKGGSVAAGIYIPDPGFTDTTPICIQSNTFTTTSGPNVKIDSPQSINQSCTQ